MIASLGMYDHPAQHAANDRLWSAIAASLHDQGVRQVSDTLDRTREVHAIWRNPRLLLGQACGYPLVADPTLALRVVALPQYDAPGCEGATHRSVLIARANDGRDTLADYRDTRAALNDPQSNTGMNLFRATLAPVASVPFFDAVHETGSHRASVVAVGSGAADIAAIDCVTYAALARFEPALTAPLKIVAQSALSPTLPFVTAAGTPDETVAALRIALDRAVADPALADVRAALFLTGAEAANRPALAPILALETGAVQAGYADLR